MAVLALISDEMVDGYRGRPTNDHGKLRIQYFNLSAVAVAGDANTTIELCKLPPGAKRILPCLSRITTSAFGAARTLDIGHRAYVKNNTEAGGAVFSSSEAEAENAFVTALDVSAAVNAAAWSTVLEYDIFSINEVTLYAKVEGGTIPVGATLEGFVVYVYE